MSIPTTVSFNQASFSKSVTPTVQAIATTSATHLKQFARQPKKIGLVAAGIVGSVLFISLVKPLNSPRPASDSSATVAATSSSATTSATASPNAPDAPDAPVAMLLMQAKQLREQNQFQQAVQVYDQAIALDPSDQKRTGDAATA
ncbi:MAG: hypothetical protein HC895_10650 [Leptolyngbyaceae cyanobacterium SM1_3_5]|nr:hypothetical protein [Leptolyngbyaceae cyanobacterium SM1_3_5]